MRQRVEDLGRLSVLIRMALTHDLFDQEILPRRPKDYAEWFSALSEEQKDDTLRALIYGIDDVKSQLCNMLEIADGGDVFNEFEYEQN